MNHVYFGISTRFSITLSVVVLLISVSGCQAVSPSGPAAEPTSRTSESAMAVHLFVNPAMAGVDENGLLILYTTLIFTADQGRAVNIHPFAWDAYILSSPDIQIERSPPLGSPELFVVGTLGGAMRLRELAVSVGQVPVAIDYRLSPGENWIYQLDRFRTDHNGPIRFRLKYSFKGIESNAAEFVVQIAGCNATRP